MVASTMSLAWYRSLSAAISSGPSTACACTVFHSTFSFLFRRWDVHSSTCWSRCIGAPCYATMDTGRCVYDRVNLYVGAKPSQGTRGRGASIPYRDFYDSGPFHGRNLPPALSPGDPISPSVPPPPRHPAIPSVSRRGALSFLTPFLCGSGRFPPFLRRVAGRSFARGR